MFHLDLDLFNEQACFFDFDFNVLNVFLTGDATEHERSFIHKKPKQFKGMHSVVSIQMTGQ